MMISIFWECVLTWAAEEFILLIKDIVFYYMTEYQTNPDTIKGIIMELILNLLRLTLLRVYQMSHMDSTKWYNV